MNSRRSVRPPPSHPRGRKSAAGLALAVAAAAYAFLAPLANERFGWQLPEWESSGPSEKMAGDSDRPVSPTDAPQPSVENRQISQQDAADERRLHGLLEEVGPERYQSPAGLLYTPGSQEGHRLKHVARHAEDQPGRPGSHGVFDGGIEGTLETIDLAYQQAKKGQRTTTKRDGRRTIHTVEMGKRVGFVGGQTGRRKRNPMARRVLLVLEDNRVITAYPK